MPLILKSALPLSGSLKNYFVHAGSLAIGRFFQTELSGAVVRWHFFNVITIREISLDREFFATHFV